MAGRYYNWARFRYSGDPDLGRAFVSEGRKYLGELVNQMELSGNQFGERDVRNALGVKFRVLMNNGQPLVEIDVRGLTVASERIPAFRGVIVTPSSTLEGGTPDPALFRQVLLQPVMQDEREDWIPWWYSSDYHPIDPAPATARYYGLVPTASTGGYVDGLNFVGNVDWRGSDGSTLHCSWYGPLTRYGCLSITDDQLGRWVFARGRVMFDSLDEDRPSFRVASAALRRLDGALYLLVIGVTTDSNTEFIRRYTIISDTDGFAWGEMLELASWDNPYRNSNVSGPGLACMWAFNASATQAVRVGYENLPDLSGSSDNPLSFEYCIVGIERVTVDEDMESAEYEFERPIDGQVEQPAITDPSCDPSTACVILNPADIDTVRPYSVAVESLTPLNYNVDGMAAAANTGCFDDGRIDTVGALITDASKTVSKVLRKPYAVDFKGDTETILWASWKAEHGLVIAASYEGGAAECSGTALGTETEWIKRWTEYEIGDATVVVPWQYDMDVHAFSTDLNNGSRKRYWWHPPWAEVMPRENGFVYTQGRVVFMDIRNDLLVVREDWNEIDSLVLHTTAALPEPYSDTVISGASIVLNEFGTWKSTYTRTRFIANRTTGRQGGKRHFRFSVHHGDRTLTSEFSQWVDNGPYEWNPTTDDTTNFSDKTEPCNSVRESWFVGFGVNDLFQVVGGVTYEPSCWSVTETGTTYPSFALNSAGSPIEGVESTETGVLQQSQRLWQSDYPAGTFFEDLLERVWYGAWTVFEDRLVFSMPQGWIEGADPLEFGDRTYFNHIDPGPANLPDYTAWTEQTYRFYPLWGYPGDITG